MKTKSIFCVFAALSIFTGCQNSSTDMQESSEQNTLQSETSTLTESTILSEADSVSEEYEYTDSDRLVAKWFSEYMSDPESFTDVTDYQYYARTLGLGKDHFLSDDMWEVFYNADVNINREIDCKDIYLIRLDPNKLMDIYSENRNISVDELCKSLSVTHDQLYYNWGYNPASIDYESKHKDNKITYSNKEIDIFGAFNGENRADVMKTHMLEVSFDGDVTYKSDVSDRLKIKRRDALYAYTDNEYLYSAYSEDEKAAQFTVNGIGIRAVIPLTIPNAWNEAENDLNITPMINVSPYSYGCTNKDIIDFAGLNEEER